MKNKVELFTAILMGTASPDEQSEFDELILKEDEKILFRQFENVWEEADNVKTYRYHNSKQAFHALNKKLLQKKQSRKKYLWVATSGIAAGIIIMIGLFSLFLQLNTMSQQATVVFETETGNRSLIVLPDSTKVWLNAKTQISYASDFGQNDRNVFLKGEGYFDVSHSIKPFIVNLGEFKVQVYGTKFNISSYEDDTEIATCLESGKISIKQAGKRELFVEPGQLITYDKSLKKFTLNKVQTDEYSGWRANKMYLHNEALQSLAKKLERKYNVSIQFIPEQLGKEIHYSGIFDNENAEEVLDAIMIASGLQYSKKGNIITVRSRQMN